MLAAAPEGHELCVPVPCLQLREAHQLPGIGEVRIAPQALEDGNRPLRDPPEGIGVR